MSKVMINQNSLESFSEILDDIQFSIKLELGQDCSKAKIHDLLDDLINAWADTYNPIDLQVARSMRKLYGNYLKAKNSGDTEQADIFLDCYLALRKK
jgi:hypothetical protein